MPLVAKASDAWLSRWSDALQGQLMSGGAILGRSPQQELGDQFSAQSRTAATRTLDGEPHPRQKE
jgi:hypothetical protein